MITAIATTDITTTTNSALERSLLDGGTQS